MKSNYCQNTQGWILTFGSVKTPLYHRDPALFSIGNQGVFLISSGTETYINHIIYIKSMKTIKQFIRSFFLSRWMKRNEQTLNYRGIGVY